MTSEAYHVESLGLNYHFLAQNSNSVFNTVAQAGLLQPNTDGFAPGYELNLNTVNPNAQPGMLGPQQVSHLDGTAGNDVLQGNATGQQIDGFAGNDQLTGTSGLDMILGGDGADTISLVGGSADGGLGSDGITVTGALTVRVELNGGDGNDTLNASNQMDNLVGGLGDDWMHGKQGADEENGGPGNDTMYGGQGNDFIRGGDGLDLIYGDADDDLVMGNDGADTIQGAAGNDTVMGGGENDYLYGGQGNDLIIGGHFQDFMWGNLGADTFKIDAKNADWFAIDDSAFQFLPPYGWINKGDHIMDFTSGVDKIDLSDMDISFANLHFVQQGSILEVNIIYPNGGGARPDGVIYLENVSSVQPSDFIF